MERNSEKRRRAKYAPGQSISPIVKYKDDYGSQRTIHDAWKYRQGNEINNDKHERRQSNPEIDNTKNYNCPTDFQKTTRKHGVAKPSRVKYVIPHVHEELHGIENKNQAPLRLSGNQLLRQYADNANYPKNIAVVRKNRYVNDSDEEEDLEDFNGNDNGAEETCEEVVNEERRQDATVFDEKDYEKHEADDEIDEESDAFERQPDKTRLQRKIWIEPLPRGQKISSAPVLSRCHRGVKIGTGKTSKRGCHSASDRKAPEIPTEEEEEEELDVRESICHSPKKLTWRSRRGEEIAWTPGRKVVERYPELPERSLLFDNRPARRPRTMRPEMERSTKPHHESTCNIKCDRCGRTSGPAPKTTSSRNATCRLQDSRYFIGEATGDEIFGDPPTGPMGYQTKPRRSKDRRSPIPESNEEEATIDDDDGDEIGAIYKSCRGKHVRATTNVRRSSMRAGERHGEKLKSKNSKRY